MVAGIVALMSDKLSCMFFWLLYVTCAPGSAGLAEQMTMSFVFIAAKTTKPAKQSASGRSVLVTCALRIHSQWQCSASLCVSSAFGPAMLVAMCFLLLVP